jgi:putative chitinase
MPDLKEMTVETLLAVMPSLTKERAGVYVRDCAAACAEFDVSARPARVAAFLAQVAHESAELRHWRELWGPTPHQRAYEPPSAKARELGNDAPGDGYRYRGRGPIQLTGRANYRLSGAVLGLDLEAQPDLVASSSVGFRVAALFWASHGLNNYADQETREAFRVITRRINGGLLGLEQRERYHDSARRALGLAALGKVSE